MAVLQHRDLPREHLEPTWIPSRQPLCSAPLFRQGHRCWLCRHACHIHLAELREDSNEEQREGSSLPPVNELPAGQGTLWDTNNQNTPGSKPNSWCATNLHLPQPTQKKKLSKTSLHSPLHGSGFDIHHQQLWSICVHMLAMGRRQMCYNFFYALIFANAVYNDGCLSLPNCVWSSGSSLQNHTQDASCRLKPQSQDRRHWARAEAVYRCMYACIYSSAKGGPPGDSRSSTDALQMVLNPDLWKLRMTFSKQYFEKYGWGQRLKIKEQASVHPLIYICSTWKGTVCYVDKTDNFLREVFNLSLGLALLSLWLSRSTGSMGCSEMAFTRNASFYYRNLDTPCGPNRILKCPLWFLIVGGTHALEASASSLTSTTPTRICAHWISLFFSPITFEPWSHSELREKKDFLLW